MAQGRNKINEPQGSERSNTENAVSDAAYRAILHTSTLGFCIIEMLFDADNEPIDYRFLEVNASFEQQTGLSNPIGRRMREMAPLHEAVWFDRYGRVALTGEPQYFEQRAEQLQRFYEVQAFRVGEAEQHRVAILFNDITERTWTEEALHQSEERFRLLVDGARDYAMFLLNPDNQITFWSVGAERVFGWSEAEAIGQTGAIIFTPEDREHGAFEREQYTARMVGRAEDRRWHIRKDGSRLFVDGIMIRLDGDQSQLRGYVKIGRDATALHMAEAALQASHAELEQRVIARTAALYEANEERTSLLQRVLTAQEDERQHISRELHDSLGQWITGLMLRIATIDTKSDQFPELRADLADLRAVVQAMDRELDRLTMELRPPALSDLGLAEALRDHIAEWTTSSGIPVDILLHGVSDTRLPTLIETHIYRIVQEALTNILKSAQATQVSVIIERRPNRLQMIIEDNGVGFDEEAVRQHRRGGRQVGLMSMRERAALIGGTLLIESSSGSGTSIYVTIPLIPDDER